MQKGRERRGWPGGLATWRLVSGGSTAGLWTARTGQGRPLGGGPGPPVHGGPATRALSRGPSWTAREAGERRGWAAAGRHGRGRGGSTGRRAGPCGGEPRAGSRHARCGGRYARGGRGRERPGRAVHSRGRVDGGGVLRRAPFAWQEGGENARTMPSHSTCSCGALGNLTLAREVAEREVDGGGVGSASSAAALRTLLLGLR